MKRVLRLLPLLLALALVAEANDPKYALIEAEDHTVGDFFRVRLRVQTQERVTVTVAKGIAEHVIGRRLRRRDVHVVEVVVHGAGAVDTAYPAAYVLWAANGNGAVRPIGAPGDYSSHSFTVLVEKAAREALLTSPMNAGAGSDAASPPAIGRPSSAAPAPRTVEPAERMPPGNGHRYTSPAAPTPSTTGGSRARTPVTLPGRTTAPPPRPTAVAASDPGQASRDRSIDRADVMTLLSRWTRAWEAKNLDQYISFYDDEFHSKDRDLGAWMEHKAGVFSRPGDVSIDLSEIEIESETDRIIVHFVQDYQSEALSDRGLKRLVLVRRGGGFKILREEWSAL